MIAVLRHRGPDDWGYYVSPEIALGQSRLSIVDLQGGKQPMMIDDYVMVYNGELYNYIELRAQLEQKGIRFSTTSDTEVLLRSYIFYGNEAFKLFNGQFAVLIWNKSKKKLLAARDRFSIRPLYYSYWKKNIYFASEMKAFDQIAGFSRNYHPAHLFEHGLLWNTLGDRTVYEGIHSLPGGTLIEFEAGEITARERYYEIGRERLPDCKDYREAEEAFTDVLEDSVKLRLRSDVPVGAYLSGGIDSSVILSLISKYQSASYKSFSVTFADTEFDESEYQHDMVDLLNTEHFSEHITYEKVDIAFPEVIYHAERPVFRTAPAPLFLLSGLVNKENIKVVLTGEGADEILWGYDSFKELKLLEFWQRQPGSKIRPQLIRSLYPHLNHFADEGQFGMLRMFYEGFLGEVDNELASLNIRVHNNAILQKYFDRSLEIMYDKEKLIGMLAPDMPGNYSDWNSLQRNQFLEMKTLLAGYLLSSQGDRMSLAHSVEGRYPFLDHRVVDLLFYFSDRYKLNGFKQKYMLRRAFSGSLPQSILDRPKRPYMSPDLKSFMRGGKLSEQAVFFLNDALIRDYGIFNPKWVDRFIRKFKENNPKNIGYRDNMIITFILSTQIAKYWADHPRKAVPEKDPGRAIIEGY